MSLLLLLAAAPSALPAPNNAAPDQAIVVTGTPLGDLPATGAYAVSTIERARLDAVPSGRIEDALADVAGLQLFRRSDSRAANPSADGFTLRGLGGNAASRTLVLLDGVPQADPFFGSVPLTAINAADLATIRVERGGGSGAFGAGAVAGTIDMTSAGPDQRGLLSGEALVDDRGDTATSASLAPRLGEGFAVVSGQWNRGPGFWTTPVDQRVAASAKARYESWSVGVRAVARVANDVELQAHLGAFQDAQTLRFVGADTGMSGENASLRLVGKGHWQFDVLAYGSLRDFHNTTVSATTYLPTVAQRETPSDGIGGKIELRPPVGGGHVLRLGADWREVSGYETEDKYKSGTVNSHQREGGTNDDIGLYAEDAWTLGPVELTAGARADRWVIRNGEVQTFALDWTPQTDTSYDSRAGWTGSFRGGAVIHAVHAIDLRASAYSGMRMPTLNELYRSFAVFPVTTLANPALVNEGLRGVEGGIDWRPANGIALHLTGFDNKLTNAIANITLGNANTQQRQNVPGIHAQGIEAGAEARLGTLSLGGSLAWTVAKMEAPGQAYDGLRPPQTPRITASANASWTPRPGWQLSVTLRHVGVAYEDSLATAALPAATTLGASATVPLAHWASFVLRGENLTDATMITRNSGSPATFDLAQPRTVWAGVRIHMR